MKRRASKWTTIRGPVCPTSLPLVMLQTEWRSRPLPSWKGWPLPILFLGRGQLHQTTGRCDAKPHLDLPTVCISHTAAFHLACHGPALQKLKKESGEMLAQANCSSLEWCNCSQEKLPAREHLLTNVCRCPQHALCSHPWRMSAVQRRRRSRSTLAALMSTSQNLSP